jgi:hypothetical protein
MAKKTGKKRKNASVHETATEADRDLARTVDRYGEKLEDVSCQVIAVKDG